MALKELNVSGTLSWCPAALNPRLLVIGSGGLSSALSFSEFNISDTSKECQVVKSVELDHSSIRSLSWSSVGRMGKDAGSVPAALGVLAGGINNSVYLWNPDVILRSPGTSEGPADRLATIEILPVASTISCVQFNQQIPSVLACGGSDGSLSIVDLAGHQRVDRFDAPDSASVTAGGYVASDVSCISWNNTVHHVVASASTNGQTVVWNLKQRKPSICFGDPAGRTRPSSLSWVPNQATQIIVAYDDDRHPSLQMWDLRNTSYPYKETPAHTKGIVSTQFCPLEDHLMVSCAKDSSVICWSFENRLPNMFCQFSSPGVSQVVWSPAEPGIVACASQTELSTFHSINAYPRLSDYVPAWCSRPSGVAQGFSGRMVSFNEEKGPVLIRRNVTTDLGLVTQSDAFESVLSSGNYESYCDHRMRAAGDEHERCTWTIIRQFFSEEVDVRADIVQKLGFVKEDIMRQVEAYLGHSPGALLQPEAQAVEPSPMEVQKRASSSRFPETQQLDDPGKFFEELADAATEAGESASVLRSASALSGQRTSDRIPQGLSLAQGGPMTKRPRDQEHSDWDTAPGSLIKNCFLLGDRTAAVDVCLTSGRNADALLLAATSGDPVLWENTRKAYIKAKDDKFLSTLSRVLDGSFAELVEVGDLAHWEEILVILCTYCPQAEFQRFCARVADRLEKEKFDIRAALVCYLCAGDFPSTIQIWTNIAASQGAIPGGLQLLVQNMAVLKAATRFTGHDDLFSAKVTDYAELLANSGRVTAAMRHLCLVGDGGVFGTSQTAILRDRIFNSSPEAMRIAAIRAPTSPFEPYDLQPSPDFMRTQTVAQSQPRQPQRPMADPGALQRHPGGAMAATSYHAAHNNIAAQPYGFPGQPSHPEFPSVGATRSAVAVDSAMYHQPGQRQQAYTPTTHSAGYSFQTSHMQPLQPSAAGGVAPPTPGPGIRATTSVQQPLYVPGRGPTPSSQSHLGPQSLQAGVRPIGSFGGSPSGSQDLRASPPSAACHTIRPPVGGPRPPCGTVTQPAGPLNAAPHVPSAVSSVGPVASYSSSYAPSRPPVSPHPILQPQRPSASQVATQGPPSVSPSAPYLPPHQQRLPAMNYPTQQPPALNQQHEASRSGSRMGSGPISSTAPTAAAVHQVPGMPVPWPIPTDAQQRTSWTTSTQQENQRIQQAAAAVPDGPCMNPHDLDVVHRILTNATTAACQNDSNPKKLEDQRKRLNELFEKLSTGKLTAELQTSVLHFCRVYESGDVSTASRLQLEMATSSGWATHKNWMMALKRLLPK